jgi:hypothetical protein
LDQHRVRNSSRLPVITASFMTLPAIFKSKGLCMPVIFYLNSSLNLNQIDFSNCDTFLIDISGMAMCDNWSAGNGPTVLELAFKN